MAGIPGDARGQSPAWHIARAAAIDQAANLVLEAWFRSGIRAEDPVAEEALIALSIAVGGNTT